MIKSSNFFQAVVVSFLLSGCVLSGTPAEDPVFVFPGSTKTFGAVALGNLDNLLWFVDDVQVQSGGDTYAYTAPDHGAIDHVIVVELPGALGNDRYQWNVNTDADVAASSPNNPHIPPGPGPWFEGWYTRVSDVGGNRSIAIIGASSLPKDQVYVPGAYLPGYINVLVSEGNGAPTFSYTVYPEETISLVEGEPISDNPVPGAPANFEWIAEGFGRITQDLVDITIPGVLDLRIRTENRLPWDPYTPDIGPYKWLDLVPLPLRWWIHSLGSDAEYEYTLLAKGPSKTVNGIGYAHQEKNWGAGFPIGWVWTQGIAEDNRAQFVMSTAEVDMGLFILEAWIGGYRSPVVSWDFGFFMPDMVMVTTHDACAGTFFFEVTDADRRLTFDAFAPIGSYGDVSTPSEEGFMPETGEESFSATVEVSAYAGEWMIDHRIFTNAALEFGTGYVCE